MHLVPNLMLSSVLEQLGQNLAVDHRTNLRLASCHFRPKRSKGRFNDNVKTVNESNARKSTFFLSSLIFVSLFQIDDMDCKKQGFNCTFVHVSSPEYGTVGHWLSEVNAIK